AAATQLATPGGVRDDGEPAARVPSGRAGGGVERDGHRSRRAGDRGARPVVADLLGGDRLDRGRCRTPSMAARAGPRAGGARLQWRPAGGIGGFTSYILPGFTLGWFVVAGMMRLLRSGMLEVLDSEYVKLARVKGVVESRVVWVHALKNALIPVVTFAGIYFSILVTTAIVVETVFAWPGLGRLAYEAISSRDFPVIQAVVLTTAAIVAVVNLSVDCVYAFIDPRIRYVR